MSRQIKFRSANYNNNTDKFSHFTYWGRIDHKGDHSEDCFTSPSTSNKSYKKFEEQCTCLLDWNGDEIFEGDKLSNPSKEVGIVEWYNAGFSLKCVRRNKAIFYIPLDSGFVANKTICGNIHANPDLL